MADSQKLSIDELRQRVNAISGQYDAHFAGQPRISRDPMLMEGMRDALASVVGALLDSKESPDRDSVLETAKHNLGLYEQEIKAITQAQSSGPDAVEAHRLATWVTLATRRYQRHFAGQSRATRDLGLLAELIGDLERLKEDISGLAAEFENAELLEGRQIVERSVTLYRAERVEIVAARSRSTLEEQVNLLAAVANEQFQMYQDHFAGKSRLSRRPDLLVRIITSLEEVQAQMRALGVLQPENASNQKNIGTVQGRLDFYRGEVEEVRKVRQTSSFDDLVAALGSAANQVFDEYRKSFAGADRASRELKQLSRMSDQLYEVAHQMDDLDRVRENDSNVANLAIVLDTLRLYEREYDEIRKVQVASTAP